MTSTQTIEAIHLHLDNTPTDWQARRELADLLEDEGRMDEARYQRWAAQWEKAPQYDPEYQRDRDNHWYWWGRGLGNPSVSIGGIVHSLNPRNYYSGGYRTRQEAERELMRVVIEKGMA